MVKNKNKIYGILDLLDPTLILVSETHVTKDIIDSEISLTGYKFERCNSHSRHTGGVGIYIKEGIEYEIVSNENMFNSAWILFIKVQKSHFGVVYRSPSSSEAEFIRNFQKWCYDNLDYDYVNIICGDFNINLLSENIYGKRLKCLFDEIGVKQFIGEPTRVATNSSTLIDFVISNDFNINAKVLNNLIISDHKTIYIKYKDSNRNYNKVTAKKLIYDTNQYKDILNRKYWINEDVSLHELTENFSINIRDTIKSFIVPRQSTRGQNNWYDNSCRNWRDRVDGLHYEAVLTGDFIEYNRERNLYLNHINYVQNKSLCESIQNNSKNGKKMWQILKSIISDKEQKVLNCIDFDGNKIKNNDVIANKLNNFFIESIETINNSISQDKNFIYYKTPKISEKNFKFKPVNFRDLKLIMKNTKSKLDFNFISSKILLDTIDIVGHIYIKIINDSLITGIFPEYYKESLVTPIAKVKNSIKCENMRPVNSLPTEEKILEKIVKAQLESFLEENKLITDVQSGFRQNYSCETAINFVIEEWKEELEKGNITVAVFIDETRAFETLDRKLLVQRMEELGVRSTEKLWFESYLENRHQRVKFNNSVSERMEVKLGVPQGSVLAPLLFLMYTNDIECILRHSKVKLFADDTLLYISGKSLEEIIPKLNEDLENLYRWLNNRKLKANGSKTKYMIIRTRQRSINENVILKLGESILEQVTEIKYLGIVIDKFLTFRSNGEMICKKVAKKISFLARIAKKIPKFCRITIYNAIVLPYFSYCSSILFLSDTAIMNKFQILQNRAMRIILRCDRYTPIRDMLSNLNWMSIKQRIVFSTLVFIFKIKNGLMPNYLSQNIQIVRDVTSRSLRSGDNFRVKFRRKSIARNSIFHKGLELFNSLSREAKAENNLKKFKTKIYNYVICNF